MEFMGIKFELASPLQLQAAGMRICSKCHKKTLQEQHSDDSHVWMQCTKCHRVVYLQKLTAPSNRPSHE